MSERKTFPLDKFEQQLQDRMHAALLFADSASDAAYLAYCRELRTLRLIAYDVDLDGHKIMDNAHRELQSLSSYKGRYYNTEYLNTLGPYK